MAFLMLMLTLVSPALAQNAASQVPDSQLPPAVVAELRRLENQFELALSQDCPAEKCFSRGCTYGAHAVADKPRSGSLPGLGDERGPGASQAQEYLTQARCELASETSIPARDVQVLVKRLEQKLSKGYLVVTVEAKPLPPLPATLKTIPTPLSTAATVPTASPVAPTATPAPSPQEPWDGRTLARELWLSLLPHLHWMLALVLTTVSALALLWAWRRLGKETLEEKALAASLILPAEPKPSEEKREEKTVLLDDTAVERAYVAEQSMLWRARIEKDPHALDKVLVAWLRAGNFAPLSKAVFEFEEQVKPEFSEDGDLARRKLEFAEYLRAVKPGELPSDVDFYRQLNQHALVASLLSQSDAEVCARLRDEFGPSGIADLAARLPTRLAAILLSLIPSEDRRAVALQLPAQAAIAVARDLLRSNRASRDEMSALLAAVRAECAGLPLPPTTAAAMGGKDHGQEIDAAGVLSALLPLFDRANRKELIGSALALHAGVAPAWLQRVFFPEMLLAIPRELRTEVLLGLDLGALAAWMPTVPEGTRSRLKADMPPSLAHAIESAALSGPRVGDAQATLASDLSKAYATGQFSWHELAMNA